MLLYDNEGACYSVDMYYILYFTLIELFLPSASSGYTIGGMSFTVLVTYVMDVSSLRFLYINLSKIVSVLQNTVLCRADSPLYRSQISHYILPIMPTYGQLNILHNFIYELIINMLTF